MKVAIVGCRDFYNYDYFKKYLETIILCHSIQVDEVISGGQTGVDEMAKKWAEENNIKFTEYKADWDKYGKPAGPIRNAKIVEEADTMIAFWDQESDGTKDALAQMKETKKEHYIVKLERK